MKKDDDQVQLESEQEDNYEDEEQDQDEEPKGLSGSPAQKSLKQMQQQEHEQMYQIEKSQEEIQEQGYLQNFFECPYNYQEVIFMMVKGDQEALSESKLYIESQEIFNYYLQCIIEFS